MRTVTAGEMTTLGADRFKIGLRVDLQDADGTWVRLDTLGGIDWVKSASWTAALDQPVMDGKVVLFRDYGPDSLAPLMENSQYNRDSLDNYVPLLNAGRRLRIYTAMVNPGAIIENNWKLQIEAKVDNVSWHTHYVELPFRDIGAYLIDTQIEVEKEYSNDVAGVAVETIMQEILDDNNTGVVLYTPVSPGWIIHKFTPDLTNVLEAVRALALQIGWDVRYKFDAANAFRLTFYQPDRDATVPLHTFDADDYKDVENLNISDADVRNVIKVKYVEAATGNIGEANATDLDSISEYGRRYMEVGEDEASNIDTLAEAQALADAIKSDLATPGAIQETRNVFFWPVELGDLYRWLPNGKHYDTQQDWAVFGFSHELEKGMGWTRMQVRGKPAGAYSTWLRDFAGRERGVGVTVKDVSMTWDELAKVMRLRAIGVRTQSAEFHVSDDPTFQSVVFSQHVAMVNDEDVELLVPESTFVRGTPYYLTVVGRGGPLVGGLGSGAAAPGQGDQEVIPPITGQEYLPVFHIGYNQNPSTQTQQVFRIYAIGWVPGAEPLSVRWRVVPEHGGAPIFDWVPFEVMGSLGGLQFMKDVTVARPTNLYRHRIEVEVKDAAGRTSFKDADITPAEMWRDPNDGGRFKKNYPAIVGGLYIEDETGAQAKASAAELAAENEITARGLGADTNFTGNVGGKLASLVKAASDKADAGLDGSGYVKVAVPRSFATANIPALDGTSGRVKKSEPFNEGTSPEDTAGAQSKANVAETNAENEITARGLGADTNFTGSVGGKLASLVKAASDKADAGLAANGDVARNVPRLRAAANLPALDTTSGKFKKTESFHGTLELPEGQDGAQAKANAAELAAENEIGARGLLSDGFGGYVKPTADLGGELLSVVKTKATAGATADADLDALATAGDIDRTTKRVKSFLNKGALAEKNAVDLATADVTNKTLDNIAETATRKTVTTNEKTGAARGYTGLDATGAVQVNVPRARAAANLPAIDGTSGRVKKSEPFNEGTSPEDTTGAQAKASAAEVAAEAEITARGLSSGKILDPTVTVNSKAMSAVKVASDKADLGLAADGKIALDAPIARLPGVRVDDTRLTNELPGWYPMGTTREFKQRAAVGAPGSQTYGLLITERHWTDSSGGRIVQTFKSLDGTFERRSTVSWGAWEAWRTIEDTSGAQAKANVAEMDAIAEVNVRGLSTTGFSGIVKDSALLERAGGGTTVRADAIVSDAEGAFDYVGTEPTNVIVNGGGQDGALGASAPGWVTGNAKINADWFKFGNRSLRIDNPTAADRNDYQVVALEAGQIWEFFGWIRTTGMTGAGKGAFLYFSHQSGSGGCEFLEATNILYGDLGFRGDLGMGVPVPGPESAGAFFRMVFRVLQTGNAWAYIGLGLTGTVQGTAHFDGVTCRQLPPGLARQYDALLPGGNLKPEVKQEGKVLAKGHQAGTARYDGTAGGTPVNFPASFSSPPLVMLRGGISYAPYVAGFWNGNTYNANLAQYMRRVAQNIDADGFDLIAVLYQKTAAITTRTKAVAFTLDAVGEAASSGALSTFSGGPTTGAYDNVYNVAFRANVSAGSDPMKPWIDYSASITVVIESNDGSGWVTRATLTYSRDGQQEGTGTTSTSVVVPVSVSGLDSTDSLRLRVTNISLNGGGAAAEIVPHALEPEFSFNTQAGAENVANMTPATDDRIEWEAIQVS